MAQGPAREPHERGLFMFLGLSVLWIPDGAQVAGECQAAIIDAIGDFAGVGPNADVFPRVGVINPLAFFQHGRGDPDVRPVEDAGAVVHAAGAVGRGAGHKTDFMAGPCSVSIGSGA